MKKGALVEFMSAFGTSVPNVIIFQFNPETMRHTLSQHNAPAVPGQTGSSPLAVPGVPGETFSFSLSMDVTDELGDPNPVVREAASLVGIYARLAALEMLLYPTGTADQTTGGAGAVGGVSSGTDTAATPAQLPTVLFVWGTGRILPVRLNSLTITEKLYDKNLNPTHADAQIELRVLTPTELDTVTGRFGEIAKAAYNYSQKLREGLAVANLGSSARDVIGMLAANVDIR
jgi:hypothetical protein